MPRRFGRYELVDEIARGAHGIVYRARDVELGRTVALKMLREDESTPEAIERFRREARVAARLNHPGIVDIFEAGEEEGRPYFTMPLIEGEPLSWTIHAGGLGEREAAALLARVARAVAFAHDRGVIHRDLKPTNVLVREDGTPVITDFGIAREGPSAALTKAGELLGTPMYMSPEQVAGRTDAIDERTDVYALGVVLYEMLTKRLPFLAASFADLSSKILNDDPRPPSDFNPLIRPDLERICLRCLRKAPDERYPTAAELADDLESVARGEAVCVKPETARSRAFRLARQYRWVVVPAVAGLLGLAAGLAGGAPTEPAIPLARIESEPPEASIYIEDRFVGVTPRSIAVRESVTLRLPGYLDAVVPAPEGRSRYRLVRAGEVPEGMVYAASTGLFVDRTEVTTAQYGRFAAATGRPGRRAGAGAPVTGVSWEEAQAYATWAGKRLPRACEWREAAWGARAGDDRSAAGCVDMLAGVAEWTATVGEGGPPFRVVAGGSSERPAEECMIERQEERRADYRSRDIGFRCVMDPPWKGR